MSAYQRVALFSLVCGALLLAGCQQPRLKSGGEGLQPIEHSGMDTAMADPAADFAGYRSILIGDLEYSRLEIVQPAQTQPRYDRWELDDSDREALSQLFREQVGDVLGEGGYTLATEPGVADLRLETDLLRLKPTAPRDSDRRAIPGREDTYTRGAGRMTLESRLVDTATGETIATFENELIDPEVWSRNSIVSNRVAVQRAFSRWGLSLRRQLQALRDQDIN